MTEADRKRSLVAEVNALRGGYARRYEDRFAVGLLDLFIKLPLRVPVWAEAKIIEGNAFGPTERQWIEGERMIAAGLHVILIGWRERTIYISPWVKQADRKRCDGGIDDVIAISEYLRKHP